MKNPKATVALGDGLIVRVGPLKIAPRSWDKAEVVSSGRSRSHGHSRFWNRRLRDDRRISHAGDPRDPGARVVGAYSRSEANGAKIAKLAGKACKTFDDLDAMLAVPEIDVICICTPSGAHLEPAVAAAQAGKHVVVEKPLEITLPRCDAIIRVRSREGAALHDFSLAIQRGESRVEDGD